MLFGYICSLKITMCMKRKQLLCILFLCLITIVAKAQVEIYGFATNVNDEKQSGMVKFSSTAPATTMQRIKQVEEWATAGAWGGDAYYAMLSYATYPKGLYIIDLETGEMTQVADYMYSTLRDHFSEEKTHEYMQWVDNAILSNFKHPALKGEVYAMDWAQLIGEENVPYIDAVLENASRVLSSYGIDSEVVIPINMKDLIDRTIFFENIR